MDFQGYCGNEGMKFRKIKSRLFITTFVPSILSLKKDTASIFPSLWLISTALKELILTHSIMILDSVEEMKVPSPYSAIFPDAQTSVILSQYSLLCFSILISS